MSVSDCSAAWFWPTETRPSACFKTVSGFENGAITVRIYVVDGVQLPNFFGVNGEYFRASSSNFQT